MSAGRGGWRGPASVAGLFVLLFTAAATADLDTTGPTAAAAANLDATRPTAAGVDLDATHSRACRRIHYN